MVLSMLMPDGLNAVKVLEGEQDAGKYMETLKSSGCL